MSWTTQEKRDLLIALEKYGPNNYEQIRKCLPDRTILEIRCIIEKYKTLGFTHAQNAETFNMEQMPLSQWIKLMKRLYVNSNGVNDFIPRLLKYVALFEDRNEDGAVDLRECYLALSELSKGECIKILDPHNSHFLYGCLTQLAETVKKQDNEPMLDFMRNIEEFEGIIKQQLVKSYSKKKDTFDLNPLGVPENLLKTKENS